MHIDIPENIFDEVFYSSTSESGGVQRKCEPVLHNETWGEREKEKKSGDRMFKTVQSSKYIHEHENMWKNIKYDYPSILKKGGGLHDEIDSEVYYLRSAHKIFIKPQETIFAETNFTIIKSTPQGVWGILNSNRVLDFQSCWS